MITHEDILDAIAEAIHSHMCLYIDSEANSSATPNDFAYAKTGYAPEGHDFLFSAEDFIAEAIVGERASYELPDDGICAIDIERGWSGEAPMPTYEQVRDYVMECNMNDNFADIIADIDDMMDEE